MRLEAMDLVPMAISNELSVARPEEDLISCDIPLYDSCQT